MTVQTFFKPAGNDIADQAFLNFAEAVDIALRKATAASLSISDESIRDEFVNMLDDYLETLANFNRALRMRQLMEEAAYDDEDIQLTPEEQRQVDELVAAYFEEFGREERKKKKRTKKKVEPAEAKANNKNKKKAKANGEAAS